MNADEYEKARRIADSAHIIDWVAGQLAEREALKAEYHELFELNRKNHAQLVEMTSARDGLRAEIGRMEEREAHLRAELTSMTATAETKHQVLDLRRLCEKYGIPSGADELTWLEEQLSLLH
jgi:hypothetical protein